jgi:hypothetical protein
VREDVHRAQTDRYGATTHVSAKPLSPFRSRCTLTIIASGTAESCRDGSSRLGLSDVSPRLECCATMSHSRRLSDLEPPYRL